MLDQRCRLLRAALGFAGLPRPSYDRPSGRCEHGSIPGPASGTSRSAWRARGINQRVTRYDTRRDSGGWRLVLVAAALFDTVALAGCAAEGTTRILSYYGDETGVIGVRVLGRHRGVDFAAALGDPVIAAADGTVVRVFAGGLCGNRIVVQHPVDETPWGWTAYCHLDETNVQEGQKVKRGDVLGMAGTTGRTLGVPHVHFELWQRHPGGESFDRINPLPFIVGCFDPAKTVAYSTLEVSSEKQRPVLTYPVWCARRIK